MNSVEKAEMPIPTRIANAKSFNVSPPKKNSAPTGSSVMNVVARERRTVSQTDWLMIWAIVA